MLFAKGNVITLRGENLSKLPLQICKFIQGLLDKIKRAASIFKQMINKNKKKFSYTCMA